ncbi:uncharacterized protein TRAVEDRAFT_169007 [Trametes versicolor FP-101664 SS1]|uniref:uncharacterized protein n=1 Tax=Trametes versicolor (strain FP-101664) TaxID=717944 RepID=UPI0004623F60|nr:uncharacterized protein TRAVEDRAFT_169007 [Trametes versicolor FP-101664 SS1]EIW57321.1 hypothetical protein TRAVEDRAFT_169007 [Trametes versicolor FP-101664 SS1]
MCFEECCGNQHRGCPHFVTLYYSGEKFDCLSPACALSSAHAHPGNRNCGCNRAFRDRRKVLNLIQEPCDACKEAALAARVRRR